MAQVVAEPVELSLEPSLAQRCRDCPKAVVEGVLAAVAAPVSGVDAVGDEMVAQPLVRGDRRSDVVDVGEGDSRLGQAVADRVDGEVVRVVDACGLAVFDAGEPLFLRRCEDAAVADQAGG